MSDDSTPLYQRLLADFGLLLIAAIWGSTFFMVDQAIETVNVFVFLAFRFSIAFVILIPIFLYRLIKLKIKWKDILFGVIIGFFLFAGYTFQTFGLDLGTDPGKTAFITGLYIVLVPIFASLMLKKKPHFLSWLLILIAIVGLGLLSFDDGISFKIADILSDLLVLIGAFGFALHIVFIDKYVDKVDYTVLTLAQIGTTAILAWGFSGIMGFSPSLFIVPVFPIVFNNQVIFAMLFTGIIGTALILAVQTIAQKKTSPTHVAVIFAMEPVFGAIFAIIFANESFLPRQWGGCVLILICMILQQLVDIYFDPNKNKLQLENQTEQSTEGEIIQQE